MPTKKKTSLTKKKPNEMIPVSNNLKNSSFPIVAIGASAGGLEAFEKFFSNLPKIGMAYIIITHLDREHPSILPQLIKKYTSMPVVSIKDGTVVKLDTIYVIPTKKNVMIKHGALNLVEQDEPHYTNFPINFFFRSLAEDQGENAIAIIFSGSGADGSLGLRDIKEHSGLIIVQDPATAGFDSMPNSAIATGLVDYIMAAETIPLQLTKLIHYGRIKEGKISPELQQIFIMLRSQTGHDFSHYKLNTVCRRIEKQMFSHQIKTIAEYVRFLRVNRHELNNLFKDLLIGVTRFFRDPEAFNTLKKKVFPMVFKKKPQDYTIRVWIPACSTGEEAYSLAIILREFMDETNKYFDVQIFATDIDLNALEIARSGIYPESIAIDVSSERLKRYFTKDHNHYKIAKHIRSMVVFGEQNIIKDPPFTKLDLICCRNLLIYLNAQLQKKILPLFHYSLKPKGILFLGTSEAISGFIDHFQLIVKKWKIFERKDVVTAPYAILDFTTISRIYDNSHLPIIEQNSVDDKLNFIQTIQNFLLKNYVSPCMVINPAGDILYVHGNTDNYLRISKKKINLNIFDHTFPEIKIALIPAIRRVELQKTEIVCKNLKIKIDKKQTIIHLHVIPITQIEILHNHILVMFEKVVVVKSAVSSRGISQKRKNQKLDEIIQELQYTKENLQATIEELESGNEELQSTNEELQSTNEEIETSKEELQSLNEELIVVNTELQTTIDQLSSVNDDMTNLFNSTEIATIFLDSGLRIKRFTPKAQEIIHLIQADIGRSISHFSTTIKYDKLVENAEEVLKTLLQKNIEAESNDGRWYNIRILPYRTLANVIDGVVVTMTDVTQFKEYQKKLALLNNALQASLSYSESIVNTVREPLLVLDKDLQIVYANYSFYKVFKISQLETLGSFLYQVDNHQWDIPELINLLKKVISENTPFENFKFENNFQKIGLKEFKLNARKLQSIDSGAELILLALEPQ